MKIVYNLNKLLTIKAITAAIDDVIFKDSADVSRRTWEFLIGNQFEFRNREEMISEINSATNNRFGTEGYNHLDYTTATGVRVIEDAGSSIKYDPYNATVTVTGSRGSLLQSNTSLGHIGLDALWQEGLIERVLFQSVDWDREATETETKTEPEALEYRLRKLKEYCLKLRQSIASNTWEEYFFGMQGVYYTPGSIEEVYNLLMHEKSGINYWMPVSAVFRGNFDRIRELEELFDKSDWGLPLVTDVLKMKLENITPLDWFAKSTEQTRRSVLLY